MPAPKIPSLFKINRHKRFEFKARYYNERQERLEERRESIRKELKMEDKGQSIDPGFLQNKRAEVNRQSNRRLLLIMCVLVLIIYFIFLR